MKEIVSIERIAAARQRLAELSEFSNGPPGREIQVRQAVHLLSSVLDELETAAKDSKHEEAAAYENESRFNILAETATMPGRFLSITGKVNVAPGVTFYTRTGDWFAWLCVAMFIVLLAFRCLPRSLPGKEAWLRIKLKK